MDESEKEDMKKFGEHLKKEIATEADEANVGNTRLQNLICVGVPIYNTFAGIEGWPTIPVPAFCATPSA